MAEKFTAWLGIVAFPFNPEKDQRTVSGRTVRKFTLNVDGYENTVQIDLWPDYENVEINQGDIVIAGGKATTWESKSQLENGETRATLRWQMQPYSLQVNGGEVVRSQRPGVKQNTNSGTPAVKRKTF